MTVVWIILACLAFFTVKGIYNKKKHKTELTAKIRREFGKRPDKKLDPGRAESVVYFCRQHEKSDCYIDDITWNDLDMDRIYFLLNSCKSSIGDEYLYYLLKNPIADEKELLERDRVIEALMENEELRTRLGYFLAEIGTVKNISVYEYIGRLGNVEPDSNIKHFLQALALAAGIGFIFVNPAIGIVAACVMFFVNVITYFQRKSQIECYYSIFGYIMGMIKNSKGTAEVRTAAGSDILEQYLNVIDKSAADLKKITKGAEFFLNPMGSGDLLQTLLDYIRMAFHFDLVKFNLIVTRFTNQKEVFDNLFSNIGYLDCMLAAASYRCSADDVCKPVFTEKIAIDAEEIAHPLLSEPVRNSIKTDESILLTGSNASGKSTFLKTVAINAILAQTIYTVRASAYSSCFFRVMSSIALRDDLESGESYYIVEIKSLKRILDAVSENGRVPVLCFIDEVLRGTNTIERIAASTEILRSLDHGPGICFAATHDIELTHILEDCYRNCHFEESVEDNTVTFDYKLREGRTTTRNAIKLLAMLGYDSEIVDAATRRANEAAEKRKYLPNGRN